NMMFPVEIAPFPVSWDDDPEAEAKEQRALLALDEILERHAGKIAGVIIEPLIQGATGMRMCRPHFLRALEKRVREADTLLILDEVMTGFGRTGEIFACVKAGIHPDFVCLSKGLTGGFLPMSLTVTREFVYQAFLGTETSKAFLHGHSYTANPLGCAAGLASLDLLEAPACQQRIKDIEAIHRQRLPGIARRAGISKARVCGTIAAFDLAGQGYGGALSNRLKNEFLGKGLLMRPMGDVLYLLPPYCITDMELHRAWDIIDGVIAHL
ncbi:MAG TPA: aminotransferase class III-fold pyridoxal phosphate-dependent enzyme, partial [Magnetospirillum sp.]|nr:aminotransferase class III-fold pyridoxal phosphate-dependent enzyme [Magnetospirillum sp.]